MEQIKQRNIKKNNQTDDNSIDSENNRKLAIRVSTTSIIINVILSMLKFLTGVYAKSGAMISDAVHSASDVFSTFIVIIGVNISNKKSDKEHQYGHDRLECVASIILAVILAITGIGIGFSGIQKIAFSDYGELTTPGKLALYAALVSIVVKEWMYWFTRAAAKKVNSGALMADAWHHRSDALSSVGAFIGIIGARLGFPIFDPVASLVICLFIGKAAYNIFVDSIDKMVDKSCDEDTVLKMKEVIARQDEVIGIDQIRTRLFGAKIYVDIEIALEGNLTLTESHRIAEKVHDLIEKEFPKVKHCMVHVNPCEDNILK